MPQGLECYRSIGPFTPDNLPAGLLREHRLAAGVWGRLRVTRGKVSFCWDDGGRARVDLSSGDELAVPPQRPHHLVLDEAADLLLEIAFHKAPETKAPVRLRE